MKGFGQQADRLLRCRIKVVGIGNILPAGTVVGIRDRRLAEIVQLLLRLLIDGVARVKVRHRIDDQ